MKMNKERLVNGLTEVVAGCVIGQLLITPCMKNYDPEEKKKARLNSLICGTLFGTASVVTTEVIKCIEEVK